MQIDNSFLAPVFLLRQSPPWHPGLTTVINVLNKNILKYAHHTWLNSKSNGKSSTVWLQSVQNVSDNLK